MLLKNQKILFLAPKFYYYHIEIINSLTLQGAKVDFYEEMPQSVLYRISKKVSKKLEVYLREKYIQTILDSIILDMYDIVFIIRGGSLVTETLDELHEKLPNAKFFMYQWDSLRQNNYLPLVKYFDKVYTFDMMDAKEHNIEYLPLFYTHHYQEIKNKKNEKQYDLVFFGAYHSDRLEIIKYIDKLFQENNLVFKYHLFITKMALVRLLMTRVISFKDLHYFKTYSVSLDDILEIYKESYAVLDVELAIQNGLTIRTFEALGADLKLITTNFNIKKESFYDVENIICIDRSNIQLDLNFFNNKNEKNSDFKIFHIDSWIKKVVLL